MQVSKQFAQKSAGVKKLPIISTPISTYPSGNLALSIALTNENSLPWFFSSYIQLYSNSNEEAFIHGNFIDADTASFECPFVSHLALNRDFIDGKWQLFSDFIIYCLDMDYYVYVFLDRFYNSEAKEYNTKHFFHQLFIYGYNLENKTFHSADFVNERYEYINVSFDGVDLGYSSYKNAKELEATGANDRVTLFKYRDGAWDFDFNMILSSLKDYQNGKDTTRMFYYHPKHEMSKDFKYGVNYYDGMLKNINQAFPDIRMFHVFYEHKQMMLWRLEYMKTKGFISEESKCGYSDISEKTLILRNLLLKAKISGVLDKEKIRQIILDVRMKEEKVLTALIKALSEFIEEMKS